MKTQNEVKHTPGPWKYHLGRGANPRFHIQTMGGYQIAMTSELIKHPQAYEENTIREANARLISSAPELLEASKNLMEFLKKPMDLRAKEDLQQFILNLKSAIAKAEGK